MEKLKMKSYKNLTEWIETFNDEHSKEFHFEIPSQWLRVTLEKIALESNETDNIKEVVEDMHIDLKSDIYFANEILNIAYEHGVVLDTKEVKSNDSYYNVPDYTAQIN